MLLLLKTNFYESNMVHLMVHLVCLCYLKCLVILILDLYMISEVLSWVGAFSQICIEQPSAVQTQNFILNSNADYKDTYGVIWSQH